MTEDPVAAIIARLDRIIALLERHLAPQPVPASGVDPAHDGAANGAGPTSQVPVFAVPSAAPAEATQPGPEAAVSALEAFLLARGIRIRTVPPPTPADATLDSLAQYIGMRYDALRPLLAKIKRAMQTGDAFEERLAGRPPEEVSANCQFCSRLHEIAFLTEYSYQRAPRYLIRARASTLPAAQRFFSGQWLERYVLASARDVAARIGLGARFEWLINPQVVLPTGEDFEFDLFLRVGEAIYWIEAKTGAYQEYVAKYARFSRLLGLDVEHALLVLAEVSEETCAGLSALFRMTVVSARSFGETFAGLLAREAGGRWSPVAPAVPPA